MEMKLKKILIDESNQVFDKKNLHFIEFPSDFRKIRYYSKFILRTVTLMEDDLILLEQQISELIANAIRHGNKRNINKKVKVWYSFNSEKAHIIIEDEGEGFKDIEKWNEFNKKRMEAINENNYDKMKEFILYKSLNSDDISGGNALFAALEYWNGGIVFNNKRNAVSVLRIFK